MIVNTAASGLTTGVPALTLGTTNAAGVATTGIATDATVAVFDATAPTTSAVGDAAAVGTVAFAARRDHVHGREAFVSPSIVLGSAAAGGVATTLIRSDATIAAFDITVPTTSAVGDAAAVGTIAFAARRDHVHGREGFVSPSIVLGTAAAAGVATTLIRSDATIAAFDATAPVAQAFGDAAAVGTIAFAARRDHRHGMPATPVTSAVAGTGVTVSAATGAVTFSVDQAFSPTWTGTHVWNPGTTPATPVQLLIAQPTVAGTRNSHNSLIRGTSFDTAGHNADWQWFASVTSNAGASTLTLQTRIDVAAFATVFSITDAGVLTVGSGNFAAPGASAVGDAIAAGTATTFTRSDHRHGREGFVSPSIVLGSAAAAGAATTLIRSDATIAAFDTTAPTTSAVGDAAAVGTIAFAARRDHTHGREGFVSPSIVFGSSAAAGAATTLIRSDATIAAFDTTAPVTQAFGDAAAVGTVAFAARRDHRHGMPASPAGGGLSMFGDGSDGATTIAADTTLSRDNFYTSLTVNASITLTVSSTGGSAGTWRVFCTGTVTVNGTLRSLGGAGSGSTGGAAVSSGTTQGSIGGAGGGTGAGTAGGGGVSGGSGGAGGTSGGNGGGAGGARTAIAASNGDLRMLPASLGTTYRGGGTLQGGGNGGGSGGGDGTNAGGGGGGGGPTVVVCAKTITVAVGGTISVAGGAGAAGVAGNAAGGGGGGGGTLLLTYNTHTNSGTETAAGGALGAGVGTGGNGVAGSAGGIITVANA